MFLIFDKVPLIVLNPLIQKLWYDDLVRGEIKLASEDVCVLVLTKLTSYNFSFRLLLSYRVTSSVAAQLMIDTVNALGSVRFVNDFIVLRNMRTIFTSGRKMGAQPVASSSQLHKFFGSSIASTTDYLHYYLTLLVIRC
jgi:hypothetical protein